MEMTLREIVISLRYIGIRTNNDFARTAALHGVKIPTQSVVPKNSSFTKEETEAADAMMQKRIAASR